MLDVPHEQAEDLANNATGRAVGQHIRDNGGAGNTNSRWQGAYENRATMAYDGALVTIA